MKKGSACDDRYVTLRAFVLGGIGHGFALDDENWLGGLSVGSGKSESQEIEGYDAFIHAVPDVGGGFTGSSRLRLTARF